MSIRTSERTIFTLIGKMLKFIVINHIAAAAAFSIYIYKFLSPKFVVTSETRYTPCEEIFKCAVENYTGEVGTYAFCPTGNNCTGDEECCLYCEETVHWHDYMSPDVGPLVLRLTNVARDPVPALVYVMGGVVVLLGLVYVINALTNYPGKIIKCAMGIMIFAGGLAMAVTIIFAGSALILDSGYYLNCHAKFALILGWLWTHLITSIDLWTRVSPQHAMKMNAQKANRRTLKNAASMGECSSKVRDEDEGIKITNNVFHKIFIWICHITILWWIFIFFYFVGLGNGRWYFKFTPRYEGQNPQLTYNIAF